MKTLTIRGNANDRIMAQAIEALEDGKIIIYPTDTLYAFAADGLNNRAIERLCRIKGLNPEKNLLSVVCADLSQAAEYARIDNRAFRVIRENTPGAFTFVLPAASTLPKVFKGRKTVGIRIPDNPIARALAEGLGHPVATASVPLPSDVDEGDNFDAEVLEAIYESNQDIELLLNFGESGSVASTIIDLTDSTDPQIIRQGKGNPI